VSGPLNVTFMYSGYAPYRDAPTVQLRRRRPSAMMHATVVVVAWAIAAVITLAVMAETKIGPVVLKVTTNHGFHAGDVYTLLVMGGFATVVTIVTVAHYAYASRRRY
jgi:hypothetical protein